MINNYKISVKDLIDFNKSSGDLGGTTLNNSRALVGSMEHRRIQESRGSTYLKEYSLKTIVEKDGILLEIYGRADGIFTELDIPVIEEIKTTTSDISTPIQEHIYQAKIYAYLYLIENRLKDINLSNLTVKLLYIKLPEKIEIEFFFNYTNSELEIFFTDFISEYLTYLINIKNWWNLRNSSLQELEFPFKNYRSGQRDFSVKVFRGIRDNETLFAKAPTGTGKSMATIFPALKALGLNYTQKIFYLTAKTVGRLAASNTLDIIRENGARIRYVTLVAKEKICINDNFNCSPEACKFAKNYYGKIKKAIDEIEVSENFSENNILEIGKKHTVCPFELSLDLTNISDVVICDYNYVFDLKVYLKRYFDNGKKDFTLLIDEAHNLPDRLRSSYSSIITREDIPPIMDSIKIISANVYDKMDKINNLLLLYNERNKLEFNILKEKPTDLINLFKEFVLSVESNIIDLDFDGKNSLIEWYFNVLFFIKLYENITDGHVIVQINNGGIGVSIEIVCNDPSFIFTKMLTKCKSHIFFSATLSPMSYYEKILLRDIEVKDIEIAYPFPLENLNIIIRPDINTTYKNRHESYEKIASIINSVIKIKPGNYIVFFPSYKYMDSVSSLIELPINIQKPFMDDKERAMFLEQFENSKNILSFAINGGIFGEGIDLVGEKLIGVIIVGVGIPQISFKNDLIKKSFNYDYAYTFPGFNKVLQASGRVIRNDNDRGSVILLDHRYNSFKYKKLFPYEWKNYLVFHNNQDMKKELEGFWS